MLVSPKRHNIASTTSDIQFTGGAGNTQLLEQQWYCECGGRRYGRHSLDFKRKHSQLGLSSGGINPYAAIKSIGDCQCV
jgi:hypothetical protein